MSVHSLSISPSHTFTKLAAEKEIILVAGEGIQGDCHRGVHVQHRSRMHIRPALPNLRQVHLIGKEVLDGVGVRPGEIGENVTTVGVDLLGLGVGSRLVFLPPSFDESGDGPPSKVGSGSGFEYDASKRGGGGGKGEEGDGAVVTGGDGGKEKEEEGRCPVVVVQGLRNPCPQIDKFRPGLKERFLVRDGERNIVGRTAGVMGTVEVGGVVRVGMRIVVERPDEFRPLGCV